MSRLLDYAIARAMPARDVGTMQRRVSADFLLSLMLTSALAAAWWLA